MVSRISFYIIGIDNVVRLGTMRLSSTDYRDYPHFHYDLLSNE